jgi:hypothetical protein
MQYSPAGLMLPFIPALLFLCVAESLAPFNVFGKVEAIFVEKGHFAADFAWTAYTQK